jgi:hypothetical protein
MNTYTFAINSERVLVPDEIVNIQAPSMGRAWSAINKAYPWKGIRLKAINDTPYTPEPEDDTYCPPDPEERYWAAAATYAERHSNDGDW